MNLSSKFSLYDTLAMIIPGGVIMAIIAHLCFGWRGISEQQTLFCCQPNTDATNDFLLIATLTAGAYVTGLVNNWICNGWFGGFRNIPSLIESELVRELESEGNIHLHKIVGRKYDNSKSNRICLIGSIIITLIEIVKNWIPCHWQFSVASAPIQKDYFQAYYKLSQSKLLGPIPFIETQVALLRNIIMPLIFCLSFVYLGNESVKFIIFIAIILSFVVMVQRQNEIYHIVWESANYYDL